MSPLAQVLRYHEQTKHHFMRYARSLGYLDWANQPNPFRRYDGAPAFPLPLLKSDEEPLSPPYDAIYQRGTVLIQPVTVWTLSRFLEYALALSAWKRAGDTQWALRSNPSSGNLHPTEGYLLLPQLDGLAEGPGFYHYAPKDHALELRAVISADVFTRLLRPFPSSAFLIGLSSIYWRESWKYGERAFRYCHHDVGHAIGTARIAAATLGWRMVLLDAVSQGTVAALLGTDRSSDFTNAEAEHPDCVAVIWPMEDRRQTLGVRGKDAIDIPLFLDPEVIKELAQGIWHGQANRLSRENPVPWEIIDDVAVATWKFSTEQYSVTVPINQSPDAISKTLHTSRTTLAAGQIIRQRRSAVSFDGKTSITAATFFRMMTMVLPCADRPQAQRPMPWDLLSWPPTIHLALFVHRVEGVPAGLYLLVRDPVKLSLLQRALNPQFIWAPAPDCPVDLPLYWLLDGDARKLATQVSCHQEIAGDSAFSLGMIAELEGRLRNDGPWMYPRLFWEAGLIGQVLYLEAEAAGVRGTGIGCFFDDPVHEVLGLKGLEFQSLYHFTIGGPIEDNRLTTLPPYGHVKREA